jgi:hypothetical protein
VLEGRYARLEPLGAAHAPELFEASWVKGASRDTAWFAMLDSEWAAMKNEYSRWLDPANFDSEGRQRARLQVRR